MSLSEQEIIETYFTHQATHRKDVGLGIGDDCALLNVPHDQRLAVCMDTLISGVHFSPKTPAEDIAYKAAAVNLSDLAAMGAEPAWLSLSLTMPDVHEKWLQAFSNGLFHILNEFNMQLVGGDITRGPLAITAQAHGFIPPNTAITRAGASKDDLIYVTGDLGAARLALDIIHHDLQVSASDNKILMRYLNRPVPRISEGLHLRSIATAAIDLSDGLLIDLTRILNFSHCGATVTVDDLPVNKILPEYLSENKAQEYALAGGDDYELCFTVAPDNEDTLLAAFSELDTPITKIGVIEKRPGLRLVDRQGNVVETPTKSGYQHF